VDVKFWTDIPAKFAKYIRIVNCRVNCSISYNILTRYATRGIKSWISSTVEKKFEYSWIMSIMPFSFVVLSYNTKHINGYDKRNFEKAKKINNISKT